MRWSVYTGGFAQTNGYLLEGPQGNVLVDAPEGVAGWLAERGVRVDFLLLTHQHYDHVLDAAAVQQAGAKLYALEEYSEEWTLEALLRARGLAVEVPPYRIDVRLDVSRALALAGWSFTLAHVPGHSPDSVTFYLGEEQRVFSGDTLFRHSIGRIDLPGGSGRQLLAGIAEHLLTLPGDTRVFPGHGPATTIADEIAGNQFLR